MSCKHVSMENYRSTQHMATSHNLLSLGVPQTPTLDSLSCMFRVVHLQVEVDRQGRACCDSKHLLGNRHI